jgi:glycosyltransferase involved in cell wall biosynthesis
VRSGPDVHILVLENEPSSRRGGQELSLLDICRGLAARGHVIDLLSTADGDLLADYGAFARRMDRVSAYAVDRSRTLRSAARLAADLVQAGRVAPDVIYANQYLDSLFGRLLAWRFQRPFVCHLRLPPPDIFCGQYRWGMERPARLIAISHQTREEYVARGFLRERIDVVHNGIAPDRWRPRGNRAGIRARLALPPDAFTIAYAGRLHPSKGVEVLIDALPLLPTDAHVVIAGRERPDGRPMPYDLQIVERAAAAGCGERCHFLGHVADVADVYAAADVTVLPSTASEAFGRTLIESMACGTPVVASRIGGIPEVLTGEFSRFLFQAGDHGALANLLNGLAGWRERDPGLAARCREHVVCHFDIAKTVDEVESSLTRTLAEWASGARPPASTDILRTAGRCASV